MQEGDTECPHGLDLRWCATCKSPPAPKGRAPAAARTRPKVERRELTAVDYGLPEGTPFIDTFMGRDYGFLSNFNRSPIEFEGETYSTVEHAFQAAKTDVPAERSKIRGLANPQWAKGQGLKVTLRPSWEAVKVDIMKDMLRRKFTVPKLADRLLATGDVLLFEGNWWGDVFWGTVNGTGQNHLGRLLMEIRDELRHGPAHRPTRSETEALPTG